MAGLLVTSANDLLTVQDGGRRGLMRYGVSQSGAMDWIRFRHAITLAGGGPQAAFEVGISGASFRVEGRLVVAVTGPGFVVHVDGSERVEFTPPVRLVLEDGETLSVRAGSSGMWAYVAVPGLDFGPPVLGSHATNARTGLGRHAFDAPFPVTDVPDLAPLSAEDIAQSSGPIGILPGPQHHLFDETVHATFATTTYRLTERVDRMGYRLSGESLKAFSHDIISDGIVEGAIQVPSDGQPIVLCADRAPTGGYPKIAVVASADLPRLTQSRPGAALSFTWLTIDVALARRRAIRREIEAGPASRVRTRFTPEFLSSRNLIGGVVDGEAWQDADHGRA